MISCLTFFTSLHYTVVEREFIIALYTIYKQIEIEFRSEVRAAIDSYVYEVFEALYRAMNTSTSSRFFLISIKKIK